MAYYSAGYGYAPTTAYALVKKLWDNLLHQQVQAGLFFKDMIGKDKGGEGNLDSTFANYPIVEKTQLGKESGDAITMSLVAQNVTSDFYNAGKTGNTQLVDYEHTMQFYHTKVYVSHWRDANAIFGKKTLRMTPFDARKTAKELLAMEIQKFKDEGLFTALYTGYSPNVIREIGTSTLLEKLPLNNVYGKNQTNYAGLMTSDVVDTELLEILGVIFIENNFNPIRYEGTESGIFVIHPRGTKTLRADSLYQDAQINAMPAGKTNPMFSRAIGKWNNIYIMEHNSIATPVNWGSITVSSDSISYAAATAPAGIGNNTDVRANLLIGANAVARAVALPEYLEMRKEDRPVCQSREERGTMFIEDFIGEEVAC